MRDLLLTVIFFVAPAIYLRMLLRGIDDVADGFAAWVIRQKRAGSGDDGE